MPSLRCLVSALTQAGGGDLLFRFASSVQSWGGEGGALQAAVAVCVGSTRRVLAWQPEAWRFLHGRAVPFPSAADSPGGQRFGALSTGAPRRFPPQPQRALPVRSQEVFRQEPGPVCRWEGVASLGLSFPLAPPPASYHQWGWGGSSLEFLSSFVLRTAGGVFRPVSFSLALPQFKKISLRLLSGPSGRSLP